MLVFHQKHASIIKDYHVHMYRDADMKLRTVRKISKIYRALVNGILKKDEVAP